jgi:hypothetical protein
MGLPWGSECRQHAVLLAAAIENAGLELPITLDLEYNAAGDSWRYSSAYKRVVDLAIRHHVPIRQDLRFDCVPPQVTLFVKQPTRYNWKILEYTQRRQQFQNSLKQPSPADVIPGGADNHDA